MNTKEEIISKLEELGIKSSNVFPKKSFLFEDVPSISCFKRELLSDFYFYNSYDRKLYILKKSELTDFQTDEFNGVIKYIVPLSKCEEIWEDVPYVELEDVSFKDMTLRDYACIHLKIPKSNHGWLNELIRSAK